MLDVVQSVLESALGSTPWLHVGSHRPAERVRRVDSAGTGEAPPDASGRIDYSVYGDGARASGSGDTDAPRVSAGSQSNPIREAVQFVHAVVGHPIAWVVGVLVLLASLTLAVVRGRQK